MAAVLVAPQAYDLAMLLSGKLFLKSGPRCAAVAIGKLCYTRKFVTITSAFITSFDVKELDPGKNCVMF